MVSYPNIRKSALLTDKNFVRQIDIDSRNVTTIYSHRPKKHKSLTHSKSEGSTGKTRQIQLHWVAFLNNHVYITSKNHGLLVLDKDWQLERILRPQRAPLDSVEAIVKLSLNHVYPLSSKTLLITFVSSNGWYDEDPETIFFNINSPGTSYVLDQRLELSGKLNKISPIESISWINRRLIIIGSDSSSSFGCLPILSLSFPGTSRPSGKHLSNYHTIIFKVNYKK